MTSSQTKRSGDRSVLKRVAAILDLLSETSPSITVPDVEKRLDVSPATAYRYLGELCEVGLLHRVAGTYSPGRKVLELGYLLQSFDPMVREARPLLTEVSANSGCHVLLSRVYGDSLVNVFYAKAEGLDDIPFVPGRPLPTFRGSQSRALLGFVDRRRLRRIYDANAEDPWREKVGRDWEAFLAANNEVRRAGYYISRNELAPDTVGVAAPIFSADGEPIGALALAFSSASPPWIGEDLLVPIAMRTAKQVSALVAASSAG